MKIRIRTNEGFLAYAENECTSPIAVLRRCSELVGGETFCEAVSETGKQILINARTIIDVREEV